MKVMVVLALLLSGCSAAMCPEGTELKSNPGTYGVWQCEEKRDAVDGE
jgi:uncharacterized protein YceK